MTHYTDEQLVLYYYGEGRRGDRLERHLEACAACRARFEDLAATLSLVRPPAVPDRDDRYGLEVWQRIRHQLPERRPRRWWLAASMAATAATLVVTAFLAGRLGPRPPQAPIAAAVARTPAPSIERARLDALGDHLDRSERLLLDLEHGGGTDIRDEQAWARELVETNRLYRDAAVRAGDRTSAEVLDDLERQLLDVVHAPSTLTPAELEALRLRLDAAALLFKVRVLHDQLRGREGAPASPRKTT